jgi:fructose-1,6-bisphosphatase II
LATAVPLTAAPDGQEEPFVDRILTSDDLVSGRDVFFAATGVTHGELLGGVRFTPRRVFTESLSMRSKSGAVRVIAARHHVVRSNLIRAG